MGRRYTLANLSLALRKPSLFLYEMEHAIAKLLFELRHGRGIDVMAKDWDNLIILDACRADSFAQYNDIDGEFQTAVSRGSNSKQFIDGNFAGRDLHDTIYVTANPYVERLSDDVFFRVAYSELLDRWDDSLHTVPPESVVEATVRMGERHPDKRLIAHLMQPHAPFIGPTGRALNERLEFGIFNPKVTRNDGFAVPEVTLPDAIAQGIITEKELREAYRENVEISMEHARDLVERLDGKTVITADHGEMLGERIIVSKDYGHGTAYASELRIVPWLVVESDDRKDVVGGEPEGFDRLDDELRNSRLSALGYR